MKKIRGLKPTLKQAITLEKNGLDYRDWLIVRVYNDHLECIKRCTGEKKNAYFEVVTA